jgi:psiF repeat
MMRITFIAVAFAAAALPLVPAFALAPKEKMATCKFGADDQHLQGKARAAFMKKCMSGKDDPRGTPVAPPPGAPPPR